MTLFFTFSETNFSLFNTLEAVGIETPAIFATSFNVTYFFTIIDYLYLIALLKKIIITLSIPSKGFFKNDSLANTGPERML